MNFEMVLPIIGTLAGTVLGIIGTYLITNKSREYEQKSEYRRELRSHIDDLIKPLFGYFSEISGSIAVLDASLNEGRSIIKHATIDDLILDLDEARDALFSFQQENYKDLALYLPAPFPWVFFPFDELLSDIINQTKEGEKPKEDLKKAWNTTNSMQNDLKNIIGFKVDIKLETKHPFH